MIESTVTNAAHENAPQIVERGLTPIGTRPDHQSPSEIENVGTLPTKKRSNGATAGRMRELKQMQAELRAAGLLKTPLENFLDDPRPLRAIRRFCYECNGYSLAAATSCATRHCPLWLFRRGTQIIQPEELEPWQKSFRAWMEHVNELDSDTGENNDAAPEVDHE